MTRFRSQVCAEASIGQWGGLRKVAVLDYCRSAAEMDETVATRVATEAAYVWLGKEILPSNTSQSQWSASPHNGSMGRGAPLVPVGKGRHFCENRVVMFIGIQLALADVRIVRSLQWLRWRGWDKIK